MKDSHTSSQSREALVPVTGKLKHLSAKNLARLSVFLVEGSKVLGETPVASNGTFQFHVAKTLASQPGVDVVLGPKGLDPRSLAGHSELPRLPLHSTLRSEHGAILANFSHLKINDELIDPWWIWCREYTISGTLDDPNGCPVPGAQVTIYNVTTGIVGLVKYPIITVPTAADGTFTASFNWCSRLCIWPCWPIWWHCWPWWWEWDILAVLDSVERQIAARTAGGQGHLQLQNVAPLRQPSGADLATGQAFAASRTEAIQPDSARTALIASKFANPAIREIFPWWWWCCENPNIVFGATQGANTILDEDPNTSTRWCFPSGQSVTLNANDLALSVCSGGTTTGENAFTWTSVGGGPPTQVLVSDITYGYADGTAGNDASNMAFAGSLNLYGAISSNIAFYQVVAGLWGGDANPARGGTPPVTSAPLALSTQLISYAFIYRGATHTVEIDPVVLGPCSFNGYNNLYMTLAQRQNAPGAVTTQLGAFPSIDTGAGDFLIGWSDSGLMLTAPAQSLIGGAATGGVDLTINAYDIGGNPITLVTDAPLTLMVDTTSYNYSLALTGVYNSDGTPANQTTISGSACPAYQITTSDGGYVLLHVNVNDPNGHLYEYMIQTQYGNGTLPALVTNPAYRGYAQNPSTFTAPSVGQPYGVDPGYGVPNDTYVAPTIMVPQPQNWTFVGGGDTIQVKVTQSCCYDFQLWAGKRVTDGQTFICTWGNPAYQTVNITVASS